VGVTDLTLSLLIERLSFSGALDLLLKMKESGSRCAVSHTQRTSNNWARKRRINLN